jgi:hypothetical protein
MVEIRDIPEFKGRYLASSDGHIYTTINTRGNKLPTPKRLKETMTQWKYLHVQIRWEGRNRGKLVHVLIAQAFLGEKNGLVCNHLDGNRINNRIDNLEYCTQSENVLHAFRLGLKNPARGERIWKAALTADVIPQIRKEVAELRKNGRAPYRSMDILAKKYGVTPSALDHIAKGECWRHV